ncbi:MAG: fumarylacetoacetate hydrolase family protein [Bacteroidetes bacterium]|nr:fumarylacetoacetate hydrolase family protein [Bacteroidota bacterium]MDA1119411.1 fumarylacetoacetate hydrolase family protein [Bacteroidota bacterium]
MKIIGVGRNYVDHIKELNNAVPTSPVIFFKPETAVITRNQPFFYPSFSNDVHHEVEIIIKICKHGKNIEERFANKYFEQIGIGIDFTARDLQSEAKSKGLPWTLAKGFNGSAPISDFYPLSNYDDLNDINFHLEIDGRNVQNGNTSLMIYKVPFLIAYISQFIMLKKGDLIFTGTPKGVGPVQIGNNLKAYIEGEKLLDFNVR